MTLLLTGFEPFGDRAVNSSQQVVERLAVSRPDLVTAVLPTEYAESARRLAALIAQHQPDAVICLGVAQPRPAINLERVALNVDDAPVADNSGDLACGRMIAADGPVAYWSTLPLDAMLAALRARDIPAVISNHAGVYVCNHVFYSLRHLMEQGKRAVPCGFIHLPALRESAESPSGLSLDVMLAAVEICLEVAQEQIAIPRFP
jgi:pyroglutamyl-peptidase